MTDAELAAIRERCEGIPPGPWVSSKRPYYVEFSEWEVSGPHTRGLWMAHCQNEHIADFVAHARWDIPALLAEVVRLRALVPLTEQEAAILDTEASLYAATLRREG